VRLEQKTEHIYHGISKRICQQLVAMNCRTIQDYSREIKPFAEAYIFLSTKSESDFVNESVKLAYQSWFELYNALKVHKTEEKKRFSNGKSLTIKIYFLSLYKSDKIAWNECLSLYSAINTKRINFVQRVRMFFKRNCAEKCEYQFLT